MIGTNLPIQRWIISGNNFNCFLCSNRQERSEVTDFLCARSEGWHEQSWAGRVLWHQGSVQDRKLSFYCLRSECYLHVFKAFQTFHLNQHITVSWNSWTVLIQCERCPMTSKLSYFRMPVTVGDKYWSSPVLALPEFLLCTALHLLSLWGISTWPYETAHAGSHLSSSVWTCAFSALLQSSPPLALALWSFKCFSYTQLLLGILGRLSLPAFQ